MFQSLIEMRGAADIGLREAYCSGINRRQSLVRRFHSRSFVDSEAMDTLYTFLSGYLSKSSKKA